MLKQGSDLIVVAYPLRSTEILLVLAKGITSNDILGSEAVKKTSQTKSIA